MKIVTRTNHEPDLVKPDGVSALWGVQPPLNAGNPTDLKGYVIVEILLGGRSNKTRVTHDLSIFHKYFTPQTALSGGPRWLSPQLQVGNTETR